MERWLPLAALTLVAFTILSSVAEAAPLDLRASNCPSADTLSPEHRARVRCGALRVPENHAKPNGRTIEIAVAVIEPKSLKPTDPVVMVHGGPGGAELDSYVFRFEEPLGARTTILFDQRGAGRSGPTLCPQLGDILFGASVRGLPPDAETAELVRGHKTCHDQLVEDGIDLTQYNTDATVADMEALRTALGYDRWKVYGISYGTAVGLAYLRDHAERLNALVLDSVYPLDAPGASNIVSNMMASFKQLSDACTKNTACRARFGNVEANFQKALEGLVREPLKVPPLDATADWTDPVKISGPAFLTVIHQLLYDATAYPAIPYVIDRVAARDGEVFALLVDNFRARANSISHGAYAAVECYERFPFDSRDEYNLASAQWPLVRDQMTLIVRHFDICSNWSARARASMRMPGPTTVPTLVLAASWDPITPPAGSKRVAEELGAQFVELPFHGHGVRGDRACGAPMIRAFLDRPDRAPDAACTKTKQPPAFATSIIRAPAVAQEFAALAKHANAAAAPAAVTLASLLAFMWVSGLIWSFVGLTRAMRYGARASANFWTRPGVPLGLAALALCIALGTFAWSFIAASAGSPLLLMIGLPSTSWPAFLWPWVGIALLAWGAVTLLFGTEQADRPTAYAIHLWLVFAAGIVAVLLFAMFGLLVPDLI